MRKIVSVLLILCLCFFFVGCEDQKKEIKLHTRADMKDYAEQAIIYAISELNIYKKNEILGKMEFLELKGGTVSFFLDEKTPELQEAEGQCRVTYPETKDWASGEKTETKDFIFKISYESNGELFEAVINFDGEFYDLPDSWFEITETNESKKADEEKIKVKLNSEEQMREYALRAIRWASKKKDTEFCEIISITYHLNDDNPTRQGVSGKCLLSPEIGEDYECSFTLGITYGNNGEFMDSSFLLEGQEYYIPESWFTQ